MQESIAGELKAAGLDPANAVHVSAVFLEDLKMTADAALRKAKIDDRKQLVARRQAGSSVPSTGRHSGGRGWRLHSAGHRAARATFGTIHKITKP